MAKGQMRSNKEKKKPKAAHNVKAKGATQPGAPLNIGSGGQGGKPYGKKG